jgi:superfamily II DNA/RNA helicase
MGFIPDVERIVKNLSKMRQTLFFSATMPKEIRRLADAFLMNPKDVSVSPPASPAETVAQHLTVVGARDKRDALRKLINSENVRNALVFCNRKRDVDILYKSLKKHGFNAACLHGDMDQLSRTKTLEAFKNNEITILVASDVAARGLDIIDLSHVFNFDVPIHAEDYIHRIGRTGRAGKDGQAFTLAAPDDVDFVTAIVNLIGKEIPAHEIDGVTSVGFDAASEKRRGRGRRTPVKRASPKTEKTASTNVEAEPKPKAEKSPPKKSAAKEPRAPRNNKPRERKANEIAKGNSSNKPVIGMGDHVPAFMLRPARITDRARKA